MTDIPVTITFIDEKAYFVNLSYIRIPENESRTIIWTINTDLVPAGFTIAFDSPAITLFGDPHVQSGELLANPINVPRTSATTAELLWANNVTALQGVSFYYRIHMFGQRAVFGGATPEYYSIDHDPTIHNDPPS